MRLISPSPSNIDEAAAQIRDGAVIAYPTETVYGLAANPFDSAAIQRLFAIKGRAERQPILLIAADMAQVASVVAGISDRAQRVIDRFWPGPLSLIFPRNERVVPEVCAGGATVCVRVPASETARALCRAVGHPVTSTSANRSGEDPARRPEDLNLPGIVMCINGGPLASTQVSTVYDPDQDIVYREGAVPAADLRILLEP